MSLRIHYHLPLLSCECLVERDLLSLDRILLICEVSSPPLFRHERDETNDKEEKEGEALIYEVICHHKYVVPCILMLIVILIEYDLIVAEKPGIVVHPESKACVEQRSSKKHFYSCTVQ